MNTRFLPRTHAIGLAAATAVVGLCFAGISTEAAESFVIQSEIGATEFAPGDQIIITSLRGNEGHLALGGRYTVDGTYTLNSANKADLAWFATSRGPGTPTPVTDAEHVAISKSTGTFHLEKTLLNDGWLHLTFYVDGRPHGGVYFGEKGQEATVLRTKKWSDFSDSDFGGLKDASPDRGGAATPEPAEGANRAIMAFLGEPVPPPASLDPRDSPANLKAAFNTLGAKLGLTVRRLELDESEFPYVLYGLVAGHCDYHALASGFRQMEGYDYGGSVTRSTQQGETKFAIDIIPEARLPGDRTEDCRRRLMIRLEMLADMAAKEADSANTR